MSPLVTVIVPTFNRAETLGAAIESALAQTFADLEVVVVDDGSADDTPALLHELASRDPRVRPIRQPNSGVARARNAGLAASTGDFVAFLDSDDTWQPWHVELLLGALRRFPDAGLAWSEMVLTGPTGAPMAGTGLRDLLGAYAHVAREDLFTRSVPVRDLGVALPAEWSDREAHQGDLFSAMVKGNLILTSAAMLRRPVVEEIGGFDERLKVGEDHDYFLRATRIAPAVLVDVPDVGYRSGTADKLARPGNALPMARAYLDLVDRALANDRARIHLSPGEIAAARAHANRWVGELELAAGDSRAARSHLAESLRRRPLQPAAVLGLVLSLLPVGLSRRLLGLRRVARRSLAAVGSVLR